MKSLGFEIGIIDDFINLENAVLTLKVPIMGYYGCDRYKLLRGSYPHETLSPKIGIDYINIKFTFMSRLQVIIQLWQNSETVSYSDLRTRLYLRGADALIFDYPLHETQEYGMRIIREYWRKVKTLGFGDLPKLLIIYNHDGNEHTTVKFLQEIEAFKVEADIKDHIIYNTYSNPEVIWNWVCVNSLNKLYAEGNLLSSFRARS